MPMSARPVDPDGPQPIAARVIEDAIAARVFPAAAVDVGSSGGSLWRAAFGALTFDPSAARARVETPFDLASLTKVLATTAIAMELTRAGVLRLDERVAAFFPDWRGADRESVSVRDLLEHSSGLAARLVDAPPGGRREFEHDICTMPLEYVPRTASTYSDLGFILLGFLLADRGGAPLDAQAGDLTAAFADAERPTFGGGSASAPTMPLDDDARRGRMLVGEVHDNYASALGGVAGHAGMFGTAGAVGTVARTALRALRGDRGLPAPWTPELTQQFAARTRVPGSSRALGWDTMLATSSCGSHMSSSAIGHVGFTGTSLWIDPERDRYFVLLTNRVCAGGTIAQMRDVRRAFHDALAAL
jgi:CubicO group peptidase (beta-lactamase class C family)